LMTVLWMIIYPVSPATYWPAPLLQSPRSG
jgi:hypothetical protein